MEKLSSSLSIANITRDVEWRHSRPDGEEVKLPLSFRSNELAGEVGEACNVVKKLERERYGLRGSRDTVEHLGKELADVIITAQLTAMDAGVNLAYYVVEVFNAKSEEMGFETRMVLDESGSIRL